jgi:gamma-glutamylputrescine oxidase
MSGPLWLDEPFAQPPVRRLEGPVDVAVVGGGITGCACAAALARAGKRVRLYEAREVATGASGRNGGFALRGGANAYDVAREQLGPVVARDYWRLTEEYVEHVAELAGDAFTRTGSLRLAADAEERDALRAEFDALRADGFDAEWVDEPRGVLRGRFTAAIRHPHDGALQPARYTRRLAAAAVEAGVDVREHTRVESLEALDAEHVVVATDGYPSGLLGELEGLIIPTRGQMLATEPVAERLFDCPHYGRHGFDYWMQLPDGCLVAGGFRDFALEGEFTADEATTETIQDALQRFLEDLAGRRLEITHRWSGIFGLVLDFLPVVGRVPGDDRLWVAGGYSGHGNVLALACGELAAAAILGSPHALLDVLAPGRLLAV